MENDKSKFKIEFKKRLYRFTLTLIEFIDKLPRIMSQGGLEINYCVAGQVLSEIILRDNRQAVRKILPTISIHLSNPATKASSGWHSYGIPNEHNRHT